MIVRVMDSERPMRLRSAICTILLNSKRVSDRSGSLFCERPFSSFSALDIFWFFSRGFISSHIPIPLIRSHFPPTHPLHSTLNHRNLVWLTNALQTLNEPNDHVMMIMRAFALVAFINSRAASARGQKRPRNVV